MPPGTIGLSVMVPSSVTAEIGPLPPGRYAEVGSLGRDGQPARAAGGAVVDGITSRVATRMKEARRCGVLALRESPRGADARTESRRRVDGDEG